MMEIISSLRLFAILQRRIVLTLCSFISLLILVLPSFLAAQTSSVSAGTKSVAAGALNYLYQAGDKGYACFRIPSVVTTANGSILAFAEARKNNCGDAGDVDLVMRRSEDGGKSWSPLIVIWDDGNNTFGNPAPVLDEKTGTIILLATWNLGTDHESDIIAQKSQDTRRVFILSSSNEGLSWTKAREITTNVKLPDWTWYATGPCNGIQLRSGKYRGRLVVPCDHIEAGTKKYFSHTIFSDDGGANWNLGNSTPTDQVNECTVAELKKGRLLLNMRNYNSKRYRQTSLSKDGGMSWSALRQDSSLPEPVCQASLIRLWQSRHKPILAFSNPASQKKREGMTIKWSYDEGKTWPESLLVYAGPAAYSNLVELSATKLGLLFEAGIKSAYEGIAWVEVSNPRK